MHSETSKSCAKRRCFVHFELNMCFLLQRRAIFQHRNVKKWSVPLSFLTFWLENVLLATAAYNFSTSELQKVVRTWRVLYILTWKCASGYSGVQFFHIATSKSGPNLVCFVHFDLKMCFSLQRHAIFPHLNFKKWSKPDVFCPFWLENVLLATGACNFSTSQHQKVVRACGVLYILTCKCASRYSGVQFFHIATSKSGPRLRCFVHFDLQMCFSLQRRAIFPHRNVKKWSEPAVFCTFWLENVLLATSPCNFSTSQLQKVVRECCVLCFSLQRRAIFHFRAQWPPPHPPLYRGYFSTQPTHKSLKNTAFRDFPNISRLWIFFLLTFAQFYLLSSDSTSLLCFFIFWLCYSALLFQLSILSEVRLRNFLRQGICRKIDLQ